MDSSPRPENGGDITDLLRLASGGNRSAFDLLLPLVYVELNRLAHARLHFERRSHTLNTTALVHEAYLRLVDQTRVEWRNRHHFFAVASEAMRRVLVDYAKAKTAAKRGGKSSHASLDEAGQVPADSGMGLEHASDLLALDEALHRLQGFNPQGARIVQYRFFGGLSTEEVADVLGISDRTVRRAWTVAKAWLRRELGDRAEGATGLLGHAS